MLRGEYEGLDEKMKARRGEEVNEVAYPSVLSHINTKRRHKDREPSLERS